MAPTSETEIRDLRSLFWSDRDPSGRAFVPLADAFRRAGELGEALDLLTDGLGRHPDFSSGHLVAAWVHRDRGDLAAAEAGFRRVLDLDPENARALHGLGQLLAKGGQVAAGRRLVLRAVELDPLTEWEEGGPPHMPAETAGVREPETPEAEAPIDIRALAPEAVEGVLGDPDGLGVIVEVAHLAPDAPSGAAREAEPSPFESWDDPAGSQVAVAVEESRELPVVDIAALAPDPEPEPERELSEVGPADGTVDDPADEPVVEPVVEAVEAGAVEPAEVGAAEEEAAPYDTRTMAELFARQGLHDRAVEIYRKLVRARPGDEALAARLAELSALAGSEQPAETTAATSIEAKVEAEVEAAAAPRVEAAAESVPTVGTEPVAETEPTVGEYLRGLLEWKPGPSEGS